MNTKTKIIGQNTWQEPLPWPSIQEQEDYWKQNADTRTDSNETCEIAIEKEQQRETARSIHRQVVKMQQKQNIGYAHAYAKVCCDNCEEIDNRIQDRHPFA